MGAFVIFLIAKVLFCRCNGVANTLFETEWHTNLSLFCQKGTQNILGTINDNGDCEQSFVASKGNFSLAPYGERVPVGRERGWLMF
jgi:hypothetical protein